MNHAASIDALLRHIAARDTFVITSHTRPDGDAIGSSVAMLHILEALGKTVTVALADPVPPIYQYLPGVNRIQRNLPAATPDAAIFLECSSVDRSGFSAVPARFTINIDHHRSGQHFADFNWIDPTASAVGKMVFDLAHTARVTITPPIASALYTALLTDTGSFTYATTDASTFALAEHLVASGADPARIAQAVYFSNPVGKMRILGTALNRIEIHGPVAATFITPDDMHAACATVEDCEGIVNYLIGIARIEAAAFFRRLEDVPGEETWRISLRSKGPVDVASVAERFHGGGHRNASGCTLTGSLDAVRKTILEALAIACPSTFLETS